jgi:signal peptidase
MQGMPEGHTTREQVEALLLEARRAASPSPGARKRARRGAQHTALQKVWRVFVNVLYGAVVAALLIGLYVGVESKLNDRPASLLGYSLFTVKTGSMVPTLPIGSSIVTHLPEDPAALSAGTVITFRTTTGTIITHRILEVVDDGGVRYRTKGDNPQNAPDLELVSPDRVLGELKLVVTLPKVWQEAS